MIGRIILSALATFTVVFGVAVVFLGVASLLASQGDDAEDRIGKAGLQVVAAIFGGLTGVLLTIVNYAWGGWW